jgi:beta-lactamase regulating signal transducer with metallopeptidase domain
MLALAVKSLVVAGLFAAVLALFRNRSAALRCLVADAAFAALLLVPIAATLGPEVIFCASCRPEESRTNEAAGESVSRALPAEDAAAAPAEVSTLPVLLMSVYAAIVALRLLIIARASIGLARTTARAVPLTDRAWTSHLPDRAPETKGRPEADAPPPPGRFVSLRVSGEIDSPLTWGVIRPVIVIPAALVEERTHAGAVIAHELAHIERKDWVLATFSRIVQAFHLFNPLSWWLLRERQRTAELAADDRALHAVHPALYADDLLSVALRSQAVAGALCMSAGASELASRIDSVLDRSRSRAIVSPRRFAVAMLTAFVTGASVGTLAEPSLSPLARRVGELPGETAARALAASGTRELAVVAAAMRAEDFSKRRVGGPTRFRVTAAVPALVLALEDPRPAVRRLAIWTLDEMRIRKAVPLYRRHLADPDPSVRGQAARALGDAPDRKSVPEIVALLGDRSAEVRVQAAHALGDLRDARAGPALTRLASDLHPDVRAKARWARREISVRK